MLVLSLDRNIRIGGYKMHSFINDLYNDRLYPAEQIRPDSEEYHIILTNLSASHESFESQLNPDLNTDFEQFLEVQNKCFSLELEEAFSNGFTLGANLIIEIMSDVPRND